MYLRTLSAMAMALAMGLGLQGTAQTALPYNTHSENAICTSMNSQIDFRNDLDYESQRFVKN